MRCCPKISSLQLWLETGGYFTLEYRWHKQEAPMGRAGASALLRFLKRLRSKLLLETVMQRLVFPTSMRYNLLICCEMVTQCAIGRKHRYCILR